MRTIKKQKIIQIIQSLKHNTAIIPPAQHEEKITQIQNLEETLEKTELYITK